MTERPMEAVAQEQREVQDGPGPEDAQPGRSLWGDAVHELIRNPLFIAPLLVVLAIVSMAIVPQLWTSVDPQACQLADSKQGPSPGHPFGFTVYGCDMYSQVVYGARPDIIIAVVCTVGTMAIGVALGTLAAYFGGWVDVLISRLTDIFFGLPFILAALILLSIVGSHSIWALSAMLILFGWTQMTRIMRGSVLETKNRDYIEAARALGARSPRIIFRHVLPNAIAPAIVISTIALGTFVSAEASLTYLGVGLERPTISWGVLISGGQEWAVAGHPHLLIAPCAFLIVTVLSFILLGDALRDALDPKLR
ncbi:MAG TPA: ABC transporter permease [Nocardioidaceae bacterium]|jgi:ABC-type dipeptide/oligopeptide/nickel transport system permease subunit|nr:ABC transporter permease [Nocardioidaceae bacterium]